jgi:hypothetical protein
MAIIGVSCSYLYMGDNAIRVRGELVRGGAEVHECSIQLRSSTTDSLIRSWAIAGAFQRTFTVSPLAMEYQLAITCTGIGEVFRSTPFLVNDNKGFREPIDLGQIQIGGSPPG